MVSVNEDLQKKLRRIMGTQREAQIFGLYFTPSSVVIDGFDKRVTPIHPIQMIQLGRFVTRN